MATDDHSDEIPASITAINEFFEASNEWYDRVMKNASVVLQSAGPRVLCFGGVDADLHPERTQAFFDREFAKIGARYPRVNAALYKLRADHQELI